jgi:hypothetical protein
MDYQQLRFNQFGSRRQQIRLLINSMVHHACFRNTLASALGVTTVIGINYFSWLGVKIANDRNQNILDALHVYQNTSAFFHSNQTCQQLARVATFKCKQDSYDIVPTPAPYVCFNLSEYLCSKLGALNQQNQSSKSCVDACNNILSATAHPNSVAQEVVIIYGVLSVLFVAYICFQYIKKLQPHTSSNVLNVA